MFSSRLDTLEHLLRAGHEHYSGDDGYMQKRLIADMHPLGTQVAFTCNQPRNFSLWAQGKPTSDLDPDVRSLQAALAIIEDTRQLLAGVNPRMASYRAGPSSTAVLEPPGLLGLNYGVQTPVATAVAHLGYGIALGVLLTPG